MARRLESDKLLFVAVVVLVLFGTLMVFSASAVMASQLYGNSYYFLFRQLAWVGVGLVLMVGMMNLDYRRLASPRLIFPALGLQSVLLVAVLFRSPSHHAHRWSLPVKQLHLQCLFRRWLVCQHHPQSERDAVPQQHQ